jgi:hypothetical protein
LRERWEEAQKVLTKKQDIKPDPNISADLVEDLD